MSAAAELYACIDQVSAQGVLDVLANGTPAVDTSQPVYNSWDHQLLQYVPGYSCPIHRTLHALTQATASVELVVRLRELAAACILEALWAAGYRPCTWQGVPMPAFLQPSQPERVLAVLDPFQVYRPSDSAALGLPVARCYLWPPPEVEDNRILVLSERMLFLARGGGWSPATHHHWPERFRALARAFLLTAHVTVASRGAVQGPVTRSRARRQPPGAAAAGGVNQPVGSRLGDLPSAVLLHILKLLATPLHLWLSPLNSWD